MMAPFGVTLLITIALGFRSVHGWDAVNIWWINFLPVCTMLYLNEPLNSATLNKVALILANITYLLFHYYYVEPVEYWISAIGIYFWPISLLSFIIVTFLTFIELKNGNRHNV
jgi:hypothetical protein